MNPGDAAYTTAAVQQYLDELAGIPGDSPAAPIIRGLLARAVGRLHMVCATWLHRRYRRLASPPLNLQTEELLGAVVERLMKAMEQARPQTVRQFFALVNQHIRWELNDLARRLDERVPDVEFVDGFAAAPNSSDSPLTPNARRMLEAIDDLPEDEREVFSLVRIQGMTHPEAASVLGVSVRTVQRRLNRSIVILEEKLQDLRPQAELLGGA